VSYQEAADKQFLSLLPISASSLHFLKAHNTLSTSTVPLVYMRLSEQASNLKEVVCRRIPLEAHTQGMQEINFFMQMK
jgi:hypothetical protein